MPVSAPPLGRASTAVGPLASTVGPELAPIATAGVDPRVAEIFHRALAADPGRRPTMAELSAALGR